MVLFKRNGMGQVHPLPLSCPCLLLQRSDSSEDSSPQSFTLLLCFTTWDATSLTNPKTEIISKAKMQSTLLLLVDCNNISHGLSLLTASVVLARLGPALGALARPVGALARPVGALACENPGRADIDGPGLGPAWLWPGPQPSAELTQPEVAEAIRCEIFPTCKI
jgi:hypothetical protein